MKAPPPSLARDRQFGISVGTVLLLAAAFFWWRGRLGVAGGLAGVGLLLVVLGRFQPRLLKYPSAAWWKLAMVLGYVNARVILTLMFLLVLTPLGILWRVIGRDALGRKRSRWAGWSAYPARYRDPAHYKRMY